MGQRGHSRFGRRRASASRKHRPVVRLAVLAAALIGSTGPAWSLAAPPAAAVPDTATACRNVEIPVEVAAQAGAIAATLCVPPKATTLQILVPGNTYNRSYWQTDVEPGTYNYVRQANLAGFATLALDRLGTGSSLRPPSAAMTLPNDVATMHTVVQAVRAGELGSFDLVVGVGHSLGSVVLNHLTGQHPGAVDALVLTGFSHSINAVNAAGRVAPGYALSAGDPKFSGLGLDPLYITTQPGGREHLYAADTVAPDLLAWDDRTRDTANLVEMGGLVDFQERNVSRAINVPVFLVNGGNDPLACGLLSGDCATSRSLQQAERPWFGLRAHVAAWSVPGLGHNVTVHRNAAVVNAGITAWIEDTVGRGPGTRGSTPGTIPAPTRAQAGKADPAALAANQLLRALTPQLADAYTAAVEPVPGLGDGRNPTPAYNELLRGIANLSDLPALP